MIRNENFAKHQQVCKIVECKQCGKDIVKYVYHENGMFCNKSCSASFNNANRDENWAANRDSSYITPEYRRKQGERTKQQWKDGKHQISRQIYTSKNERVITKHFKEKFPEDEWKSGGRLVFHNKTL